MLARLRFLARERRDFAFETTLAGRGHARWITRLRASGYRAHLVFLSLPSADLAVARVAERVRQGGHAVPEDVIRRRFAAGLRKLFGLYQGAVDAWHVYDNADLAGGRNDRGRGIISPGGQPIPGLAAQPLDTPAESLTVPAAMQPEVDSIGELPSDLEAASPSAVNPLRATTPAGTALREIHRRLLGEILAHREALRERRAGEHLHDFRVGVRRSRTALRRVEGVYPGQATKAFAKELAWLGKLTTPARDLEVYVAALDEYCATADAGARREIELFGDFLRRRLDVGRDSCARGLDSERCVTLIRDWTLFLDGHEVGPDGARAIRPVAYEAIARAYRKVVSRGEPLHEGSRGRAFHRLRLAVKSYRYLNEFFGDLFDARRTGATIASLKGLQDALGALNDLRVQLRVAKGYEDPLPELRAWLRKRRNAERTRAAALVADFLGRPEVPGRSPSSLTTSASPHEVGGPRSDANQ